MWARVRSGFAPAKTERRLDDGETAWQPLPIAFAGVGAMSYARVAGHILPAGVGGSEVRSNPALSRNCEAPVGTSQVDRSRPNERQPLGGRAVRAAAAAAGPQPAFEPQDRAAVSAGRSLYAVDRQLREALAPDMA